MAGLTSGSVNIAFTIDEDIPADVTFIENAAFIRDDGTHGREPMDDNEDNDTTPIQRGTPTPPTVTPTPTDKPGNFPTNTPGPTRRPPGDNDDDDDDGEPGGGNPPIVAGTPVPPAPLPTLAPTATMPVLFLPETGERPSPIPLLVISGLGLGLGTLVTYFIRSRGKRGERRG